MPRRRAADRAEPRITLPVVLLAVVMVGGGVYAGVQAIRGNGTGGDATATSPELERVRSDAMPDPTIEPGNEPFASDAPIAYEIRYLVRRPGAPDAVETFTVSRPFTARRVTEVGGVVVNEEEASFGSVATRSSTAGSTQVIAGPPVAGDPRFDAVAAEAIERDLLVVGEERQVAGRRCRVVRRANSPDVIEPPRQGDYTDTCLDALGLVLEEWRVEDGRAVEQRVATEVDLTVGHELASNLLLPTEPTLDVTTGGGFIREAEPTSEPPGEFFVLDEPPAGFTFRGRYSVIAAQAALLDPAERDAVVASTADVYVDGKDLIVLDRGATRGTVAPFEPRASGRTVDLGPVLGEGEALAFLRGGEVRVHLPGGRFVRLYATVSSERLALIAQDVRSTPGGGGLVLRNP